MLKRTSFFTLIGIGLFYLASLTGCGSSPGDSVPGGADANLAGHWAAEKLSANGNRLVLTIDSSSGQRLASLRAIRLANGDITPISPNGTYAIDGRFLVLNFTDMNPFRSTYQIDTVTLTGGAQDVRLILGSDIYHKVTGTGGGPAVSGQIQVSPATQDQSVSVGALTLESDEETPQETANPSSPDLIVMYRDGRVKHVMIQPEAQLSPSALILEETSSSLVDRVDISLNESSRLHQLAEERRAALLSDPAVASVSSNVILHTQSWETPNDPLFSDQWNLRLLNITDTWGQVTAAPTSARDIVVAVVDTGIVNHPDLSSNVLLSHGYDFVDRHMFTSTTNSCRPGSTASWKDLSLDGDGPDADPRDDAGPGGQYHGTHMAGIIGGITDNRIGIAGMSGPAPIKILPLRAMGRCGDGTLYNVAQAIRYGAKLTPNIGDCDVTVSENDRTHTVSYTFATPPVCRTSPTDVRWQRPKADVINLSLGGAMLSGHPGLAILNSAIQEAYAAGVVVVAAAGNESKGSGWCIDEDTGRWTRNESCDFYPAANPRVLSIGGVYPNLSLAGYSNFGPHQFLVAPGGSETGDGILSTVSTDVQGGYAELTGTSQAAAHVSAVAALIKSVNPSATPENIKNFLQNSAFDLGDPNRDDSYGSGLVNPVGSLMAARGITPTASTTMKLSATSLNFGPVGTKSTILVTGGAGGTVTAVRADKATTSGGPNWLTVAVVSLNNNTAGRVNVQVNRTGLTVGNYTGTVTVSSSAGTQTIPVSMRVNSVSLTDGNAVENLRNAITQLLDGTGAFQNGVDIGDMQVLLIDATTDQLKYRTSTDFSSNYRFMMGGITPGRYYLKAGVDENQDGTICASSGSEPCLAYPSARNPQVIEITASSNLQNYNMTY